MDFAGLVGEKFGLGFGKKALSTDNDLAHVSSKIVVWKASANR